MKLMAAGTLAATMSTAAIAQDITVGVSWPNFQEERWQTDEAAIVAALWATGAGYLSADAQSSAAHQLSDVESLIAQCVDALIILAQDAAAIGPVVQLAADEGISVIAYDRLIEDERAFYLTFDNVEVGRMQARDVNDTRSLDELRVIAAAVIGGTALSGGAGTIFGAILGALIMQSLQSGMAMTGTPTPHQNIVVGVVSVLPVLLDIIYRKRVGAA